MVRLRRPPEWGVEPVPDSLRVLRTFDLFVLWSSLGAGLLVFAAGALLVQLFGLTLWEAFLVSLVGSVLGSVLLAAAGHHGSQAGVPTMVSLRPILGRSGSYAPTVLNIVQLLGWTAFELLVMAQATAIVTANFLGPWTAVVFVPAWGVVTMALALGGPLAVVRNWLERFAIWIVYGSTIAVAIALLLHPLDAGLRLPALTGSFGGPGSLLLGLDLVVAMPISWWPLISDYNRFARAPRDAAAGTTLGYIAANTSFYALGAALAFLVATGQGIGGPYESFLLLIGGLFVPLLGVVIAQTFAVRRGTYARADFFEAAPRWRWPAFASWIPGSALYFAIVLFGLPIGATLPSFALAAGLQVVFAKVDQGLARPSATSSGGNP